MLRLQVEQGSKNHELVPVSLIAQLSGSRSGGVNKGLGELAKRKLVAKMQNAKCNPSLHPYPRLL
jgi:RIO kinase 2